MSTKPKPSGPSPNSRSGCRRPRRRASDSRSEQVVTPVVTPDGVTAPRAARTRKTTTRRKVVTSPAPASGHPAAAAVIAMVKRIRLWPLDRLKPYEGNPRTHSDRQVTQIARSIKEFGFNNPILVDKESGVVAGHGRLLAARRLGLDVVPVVELTHLTPGQRHAYLIADNKIALNAGWDREQLEVELRKLDADDIDLKLLGFAETELDELLGDLEGGLADPPAPPTDTAIGVFVQCADQEEQQRVLKDLGGRGYTCRAVN